MGGCGEAVRDGASGVGSSWVLTAEGPFDPEGHSPSPSPSDSCQSAALWGVKLTPSCLAQGTLDIWLLNGVRIGNLLCKAFVHSFIQSFHKHFSVGA